jgi:hypothetical protein
VGARELSGMVTRLIAAYGGLGRLVREEPGSYDPASDDFGLVTSATFVRAVAMEDERRLADGSLLPPGVLRLFLAPAPGLAPKPGDRVDLAGAAYRLEEVRSHAPDGARVLAWECQARRLA